MNNNSTHNFRKYRKGNVIYHNDGPFTFMEESYTAIESEKMNSIGNDNLRMQSITYPLKDTTSETIFAEDAQPIALSVEWIKMLGFREGFFNKHASGMELSEIHYEKGGYCVHFDEDGYKLFPPDESPIRPFIYVHELQNLYYFTAKEELVFETT